jgi:hypothetical protein
VLVAKEHIAVEVLALPHRRSPLVARETGELAGGRAVVGLFGFRLNVAARPPVRSAAEFVVLAAEVEACAAEEGRWAEAIPVGPRARM